MNENESMGDEYEAGAVREDLRHAVEGPLPVRLSGTVVLALARRRRRARFALIGTAGGVAAAAVVVAPLLWMGGGHEAAGVGGGLPSSTGATAPGPKATSSVGVPTTQAGCPPRYGVGVAIDYVDLVHIGGREYEANPQQKVEPAQIGQVVGVVRCRLNDYTVDPTYKLRDGDATYLPVGTEIHAIGGMAVGDAVAVRDGDRFVLYARSRS